MKFLWPSTFLLLALIPLLIAAYFWLQRRRRRYALRFSSLSLVRSAIPVQSKIRRYLPVALFLLALSSLVVCLARPVAVTLVPAGRATVVLTLDISGSMRQTDVPPSRLGAAKQAALSFINRQRENNQIAIVGFAGIAQLVQPPSTDPKDLEMAVLNLTTGRGTAIGSGILIALDTINEFDQSPGNQGAAGQETPAEEDRYQPDIIVLLTDGVNTTGPHPLIAAQDAVEQGVRVYTIGFGTETGQVQQDNYFNFGGRRFSRGIDEETLKQVAAMTGGEYFSASSADELQKVFDSLPTLLKTRKETMELSVLFAAIAALLISSAVLLSKLWHPLPY